MFCAGKLKAQNFRIGENTFENTNVLLFSMDRRNTEVSSNVQDPVFVL